MNASIFLSSITEQLASPVKLLAEHFFGSVYEVALHQRHLHGTSIVNPCAIMPVSYLLELEVFMIKLPCIGFSNSVPAGQRSRRVSLSVLNFIYGKTARYSTTKLRLIKQNFCL